MNPFLAQLVDALIEQLQPTPEAIACRVALFERFTQIIRKAEKQAQPFMYGSVPLATFLPSGDLDIGVVLRSLSAVPGFFFRLQKLLEIESGVANSPLNVRSITVIDAEVKLIKCISNDLLVDVSTNTFSAYSTLKFFDAIDQMIGDSLFKRSVILIKVRKSKFFFSSSHPFITGLVYV